MNLFTFSKEEIDRWDIENDVVMGGNSRSEIDHVVIEGSNMMKFTGHVSLENDGGFAQTQFVYDEHLDLSLFNQITISGKGDGKTYNLRFETDDFEVSYESEFKADEDFNVLIKFNDLKKVFHGEPAPEKPEFDKSKIKKICILIGNKVEEDFEINIKSIVAVV